jgi:uncharacterized protein (TIGR02145 family)
MDQNLFGVFYHPVISEMMDIKLTFMKDLLGISGLVILSILQNSCKTNIDNTIKDIDGNSYSTVTIGTQVWMKENLKTTRYQNGDLIGTTSLASLDISSEFSPKYQWAYDGDERTVSRYGRLYTWQAVTDSRKLCPAGWHIPTSAEWSDLTDYLTNNNYGFERSGKDIAKSLAAKSGWSTFPTAGSVGNDQTTNNGSGFTGIPGGYRNSTGSFSGCGLVGYWWSSSETTNTNSMSRYIRFGGKIVMVDSKSKAFGLNVRCLRD